MQEEYGGFLLLRIGSCVCSFQVENINLNCLNLLIIHLFPPNVDKEIDAAQLFHNKYRLYFSFIH